MSIAKQIKRGSEARQALLRGIEQLAWSVGATLGPQGQNVVFQPRKRNPRITKDGVTVAREIRLPDPFEDMGAQIVREVAARTVQEAGDGTTTATVLAHAIFAGGLEAIEKGAKPADLKRGIEAAVAAAVVEIGKQAQQIDVTDKAALKRVALVSTNGDEVMAEMVADAMHLVGVDGVVAVQEGTGRTSTLETVRGTRLNSGYLSPYFVTDEEHMVVELKDLRVLVTDAKLASTHQLMPVLQAMAKAGEPLLVIAGEVQDQALATLVVNKTKGGMQLAAVRAPFLGERRKDLLKDVAAMTGATLVTGEVAVRPENVNPEMLGRLESVKITHDETTLIALPLGEKVNADLQARVAHARHAIEEADNDDERQFQRGRLAGLTSGVGVIRVGGQSELEVKEKKDRLDDALHAVRAAMQEGVVEGGGMALVKVGEALSRAQFDRNEGGRLLIRALGEPRLTLRRNAGIEAGEKMDVPADVVDPAKVTRVALQNAASVAALLLTTEVVIADIPEPKNPWEA